MSFPKNASNTSRILRKNNALELLRNEACFLQENFASLSKLVRILIRIVKKRQIKVIRPRFRLVQSDTERLILITERKKFAKYGEQHAWQ